LGIPSWIVEIRHNASHSHVPPIKTLRKAFEFCRQWIWVSEEFDPDNFWSRQPYEAMQSTGAVDANGDDAATSEAAIRDQKIFDAIVSYALLRNKASCVVLNPSDSIEKERAVVELRRFIMNQPCDFLRIFVDDGCLIMTEKQLNSAGYSVKKGWFIPVALQIYWKPVFVIFHEAKVISELIINLLNRLSRNGNSEQVEYQLVSWTKFFLEPCIETEVELMTVSDWSRILHKLVAAAGHFDITLVEQVMAKLPNLSDKRRRQVRRIIGISLSESLISVDDSMSVRTVEDLQKLIRKDVPSFQYDVELDFGNFGLENRVQYRVVCFCVYIDRGTVSISTESSKDGFVMCDPEEWYSVPLGLLPGTSADDFSLIIDDDYFITSKKESRQQHNLSVVIDEE
ncbi:hypothetical protein DICVIV_07325, partial [Dictyocaulus viviparus]